MTYRFASGSGPIRLGLRPLLTAWPYEAPVDHPLPPQGQEWQAIWSSDHPDYGGAGVVEFVTEAPWRIPGRSATFCEAVPSAAKTMGNGGTRAVKLPVSSEHRTHVTCKDFASFILDYLENELDAGTRDRFEYHLSICPNCVRYLAHYRATIAAGREAFREPSGSVPPEVPEDLVRAILAARAN